MKRVAALDLGSNSFLCLICEGEKGQITKVLSDELRMVRLGQGMDENKNFHPEALERAKKALAEFKTIIDRYDVNEVLAVGTSAARDAKNSQLLFEMGHKLNIPIQIIEGSQEALTSYRGAIFDQSVNKDYLLVDIGGGSTEIIHGQGREFSFKKSFDVGCVRFFERYIPCYPIPSENLHQLEQAIKKEMQPDLQKIKDIKIDEIIAVAGTPTTLAALEVGGFSEEKVHGYQLTLEKLKSRKIEFANSSLQEKIKMGIDPKRADVIIVGVMILIELLEFFQKSQITVSTKGIRYGVALQLLSENLKS